MTDILTQPQHHFSGSLSRPSSPTRATPKHMPEPMSPRMSEPCNASTRGLLRLPNSAITPSSAGNKPVSRLRFSMHHCGRNAVYVSRQPEMRP